MIVAAGLPKNCWGHAFMHATYVDQFLGGSDGSPSPHKLWFGYEVDPQLITFGAKLTFTHGEDGKKLDTPGHQGIYLGNAQYTDGYYVLDTDNERQPVRINRNTIKKSIDESHCVVQEPIGLSDEQYQLLQDELEKVRHEEQHPHQNWPAGRYPRGVQCKRKYSGFAEDQ